MVTNTTTSLESWFAYLIGPGEILVLVEFFLSWSLRPVGGREGGREGETPNAY